MIAGSSMISSPSCGVSHGGASRAPLPHGVLVLVVFVEHVDVELHLHADLEIVRVMPCVHCPSTTICSCSSFTAAMVTGS